MFKTYLIFSLQAKTDRLEYVGLVFTNDVFL